MKKIFLIFSLCAVSCFLLVFDSDAGQVIDKSQDSYFLFIPKSDLAAEKFPVLVCLPGWGIQAKQDIYNWSFPAQKNNFVVIDLDIEYSLFKSNSDVKNLYYRILNIINSLSSSYLVDTGKVYIAGTSAGGMMAMSLSLMFPERFVACGVVSGGRLGFAAAENLRNARGQNFYMVHGQKDKSIPVSEFYSTKRQLEENGATVEYNVIPEGEHTLSSSVYKAVVDWLAKYN